MYDRCNRDYIVAHKKRNYIINENENDYIISCWWLNAIGLLASHSASDLAHTDLKYRRTNIYGLLGQKRQVPNVGKKKTGGSNIC